MGKNALKDAAWTLFIISIVVFLYAYKPSYKSGPYVLITVDVERDIPPFLDSYDGVTQGVPIILDVLKDQNVKATFFVTGNVATRYPDIVGQIAAKGHEIGGQGFMHENLSSLGYDEKHEVINKTTTLLKEFDVKSFRPPYQSSDEEVMNILEELGYCAEASYERGDETHIIVIDDRNRNMVKITSEPLFYPSSTYPSSWIDVYNDALEKNEKTKTIVVGLHSWEVLSMPDVEGAEEYVRASGNYTYTNLVTLIEHLKKQKVKFLTASDVCKLLLR